MISFGFQFSMHHLVCNRMKHVKLNNVCDDMLEEKRLIIMAIEYLSNLRCSYCDEKGHDISRCKKDASIIQMIVNSKTCPDFKNMSYRLLKRLAAFYKIKVTLPALRLVIQLTRRWNNDNITNNTENICCENVIIGEDAMEIDETKKQCSICYENLEETNVCITKCSHTFCLSCIISYCKHDKKTEFQCPMCREVLYRNETQLVQQNNTPWIPQTQLNMAIDLDDIITDQGIQLPTVQEFHDFMVSMEERTNQQIENLFDISDSLIAEPIDTTTFIQNEEIAELFETPTMTSDVIRYEYNMDI